MLLPFLVAAQTPDYSQLCKNIHGQPLHEIEGDTLYMYITCAKKDSEEYEHFVRKYILLMGMDDQFKKDGYDFTYRILYQEGGTCQTWQIVFIKPSKKQKQ